MEKIKAHIDLLPIVKYPDIPDTVNNNLAVSIPLFYSDVDSNMINFDTDRMKNIHAKGAIWTAMSILMNTDLSDNGVNIHFHVEDKIYDLVLPVFDQYGVNRKHIRKVIINTVELEYKINNPIYGKKYMCLFDEINPKVWLVSDSDAFVCSKKGKINLYDKLTNGPALEEVMPMRVWEWDYSETYEGWVRGLCLAAGRPFLTDKTISLEDQEKFAIFDLQLRLKLENRIRNCTSSQFVSIPTDHGIVPFLKKNCMKCHQDEFLLGIWKHANDSIYSLKEYLGIDFYYFERNYINRDKVSSRDGYVLHVNPDENNKIKGQSNTKDWYNEFFQDLTRNFDTSKIIDDSDNQVKNINFSDVNLALKKTKSDKSIEGHHEYGRVYNWIFNSVYAKLGRKLRICEIGVSLFGEGSLAAFQELDIG